MVVLIVAVLVVVIASGICSGVEAALFSTPMIKVRQLAHDQVKGAKSLLKIRENMARPIAAIVILTNISNIVGSIVVGGIATHQLGAGLAGGIFTGVFTLLIIMFSEIIPKTFGEQKSESISLRVARPILFLTWLLTWLIWLIELVTKPFTPTVEDEPSTDENEIRYLAKLGDKEGVIERDEYEMIQGVFQLNDISVKELMTPRVSMTCLNAKSKIEDVKVDIIKSQHSRIVVIGENKDDVLGVVLRSDLLVACVEKDCKKLVEDYTFTPLVVPEEMKADEILPKFQEERQHLAVVKDEFGGVSGVVTLEDVIEELTGEIIDETDMTDDMREHDASTSK